MKSKKRKADGTWIEYSRKSVGRNPKKGFQGWETIINLAKECANTQYYNHIKKSKIMPVEKLRATLRRRDTDLVATAFLIGGRISETLMLNIDNFKIEDERVIVSNAPVLKRYKVLDETVHIRTTRPPDDEKHLWHFSYSIEGKDDEGLPIKSDGAWVRKEYTTEPVIATRDEFPIARWEPMSQRLVERIERMREAYEKQVNDEKRGPFIKQYWMFPSSVTKAARRRKKSKDKKSYGRDESPGIALWLKEKFELDMHPWMSHQHAYNIITAAGKRLKMNVWTHWFRSQRASQLKSNYNFQADHLNRYFGWRGGEKTTAELHAALNLEDLWEQMKNHRERIGNLTSGNMV